MPSQTSAQENSATGVVAAAPWRIAAVSVLPDFKLAVTFRDGRSGIVDCVGIKKSDTLGIYAPLTDPQFFAQVTLELGVLTWPNGADLDPGWLHDELAKKNAWPVPF